jgi:sodium/hydrogen antiporter
VQGFFATATLGTGARLPTVAFMGWFGPRGLASIVFALIALEKGVPDRQTLLTTVMLIILMSVFLHGLSSVPLVAAHSRWYTAHAAENPSASEAKPTIMSRLRHHPTATETEPEQTEPEQTEPEQTEPEQTEPEQTEPETVQQRPWH